MPEFQLDHGSKEASKAFTALDDFTQGYIEAMFWTECNSDNEEPDGASFDDLSPGTLAGIIADCKAFQEANQRSLDLAYDYASSNYDAAHAGHDFWLTRNRHGAGFWDRGFGKYGDLSTVGGMLTKAAQLQRESSLYRGDDGKLYLS